MFCSHAHCRDSALSDVTAEDWKKDGGWGGGGPAHSRNCFHFLHSGIKTKVCRPQHGAYQPLSMAQASFLPSSGVWS